MKDNSLVIGSIISISNQIAQGIFNSELHTFSPIFNGKTIRIAQIGSWVKIDLGIQEVIGEIINVSIKMVPYLDKNNNKINTELKTMEIKLIGELEPNKGFTRGIIHYPSIDDEIKILNKDDWCSIYPTREDTIEVGKIISSFGTKAELLIPKVISRHFLIAGMTGSGKSNFVNVLIDSIASKFSTPHVLLFDVHGEYKKTIGKLEMVNYISIDPGTASKFHFPAWLLGEKELQSILNLNFKNIDVQNIVKRLKEEHFNFLKTNKGDQLVLFPDFEDIHCFSKIPINFMQLRQELEKCSDIVVKHSFKDKAIIDEKGYYNLEQDFICYADDSPKDPKRTIETVKFSQIERGKKVFSKYRNEFKMVLNQLNQVINNPKFKFLFPNPNEYSLHEWLSDLIHIFENKVTIIDLSGINDDLKSKIIQLILLKLKAIYTHNVKQELSSLFVMIEESHIFSKISEISEIMREGRKFGLGIGLISQRPSQINPDCISQIGTYSIFRTINEMDISLLQKVLPDNFISSVPRMPLLQTGEMILIGDGSPIPQYVKVRLKSSKQEGQDSDIMIGWNKENYEDDKEKILEIFKELRDF